MKKNVVVGQNREDVGLKMYFRVLYLPKNMFRDESNPAAYILAERSFSSRLANIRQANLDIVDWELTYNL